MSHILTAEEVATIKAVAKADAFADATFRRHYLGTDKEETTLLLRWDERSKVTGEKIHRDITLPWTAFGITDYANYSKVHGYARFGDAFTCIANLIKAGDRLQIQTYLTERDYGYCEVWIERNTKSGPKAIYRGYTDVGHVGNFIG